MSGVVEHKGYYFWSNVDIVYDRVWDFLHEKFPDEIIFPELFHVDFVVLNKNIPVEVQSTIILNSKKGTDKARKIISHTQFEGAIEKQIKQNVENFGHCWFFFDSEYLRYLQNDLTKKSRINLDWLYKLMKDGIVNVFTVSYKGEITEISYKSFNFLSDISMTCKVGHEGDYRILDRNKFNILLNLLKGYGFSSDELFKIRNNFSESKTNNFISWLMRKGYSPREFIYGMILRSVGSLEFINQVLNCSVEQVKLTKSNKSILSILGLFEVKGLANGATTCFIDKYDIAKYFPGYIHNEKTWEHLRRNYVIPTTLHKIITKKINVSDIANQNDEIKRDKKEKIRKIILENHNFTIDEKTEYRTAFENDMNSGGIFPNWLQKSGRSDRQKLLGQILQFSTSTHLVDDFFGRKEDVNSFIRLKVTLRHFGFMDAVKAGKNTKLKFIDRYEISNLFEGYENNIDFWKSIKNKKFNHEVFWNLIYQKNKEQLNLI